MGKKVQILTIDKGPKLETETIKISKTAKRKFCDTFLYLFFMYLFFIFVLIYCWLNNTDNDGMSSEMLLYLTYKLCSTYSLVGGTPLPSHWQLSGITPFPQGFLSEATRVVTSFQEILSTMDITVMRSKNVTIDFIFRWTTALNFQLLYFWHMRWSYISRKKSLKLKPRNLSVLNSVHLCTDIYLKDALDNKKTFNHLLDFQSL